MLIPQLMLINVFTYFSLVFPWHGICSPIPLFFMKTLFVFLTVSFSSIIIIHFIISPPEELCS